MPEGGTDRELYSLLERFGLKSQLALLESGGEDGQVTTRIILQAYVETRDPEFFDLYYRSTYPLCMEWASNDLKQAGILIEAGEIVDEAYSLCLNTLLNNGLCIDQSPLGHLKMIVQKLVRTRIDESRPKGEKAAYAALPSVPSAVNSDLYDLFVTMEEDRRDTQQHAYIHELLTDLHAELTRDEKTVFVDYYLHRKSPGDIAADRNASISNVNKMLHGLKRKIRRRTQAIIPLNGISLNDGSCLADRTSLEGGEEEA